MVRTSAPPAHRMASVLHGARTAHGPLGIAYLEASHALGCNGKEQSFLGNGPQLMQGSASRTFDWAPQTASFAWASKRPKRDPRGAPERPSNSRRRAPHGYSSRLLPGRPRAPPEGLTPHPFHCPWPGAPGPAVGDG